MLSEHIRQQILALSLVGFVAVPVATEARLADAGAKASLTKCGLAKPGMGKIGLARK